MEQENNLNFYKNIAYFKKGTPSKKPKLQLKGIFTNDDHLYRNPQDIAGLPETLSDLDDEENRYKAIKLLIKISN